MNLYELEVDVPPHVSALISGSTWSTLVACESDEDAMVAADLWRENLATTWGTVAHVVGRVHVRTASFATLVWHDAGDEAGNLATLENSTYRFVGILPSC